MATVRARYHSTGQSVARHHAEWLSLVETSGPFLSMPILQRVFPQGLDAHDPEHAGLLRLAFAEWEANRDEPAIHHEWVRFVLHETLEWPDEAALEGQAVPPSLEKRFAEYGETLRPDVALADPDDENKARLLVSILPPDQDPEKSIPGRRWTAAPTTRMIELLRATEVRLGLVTNGEQWVLVHARKDETTSLTTWYAPLWLEEQITLRAFRSLLSVERFLSVAETDTIEAMYAESAQNQQEVTDQLGYQVRQAVEVLVSAIDRADRDRNGDLLQGTDEKVLYEAALAFMMRLVFLFFAEDQRPPLFGGNDLYDQHYAASTLREQLREDADRHGEEVLERRHDAYSRLLATFRAVHGGVEYDDMRLPAYGGTLFDPDRYPFLEGRAPGTRWREDSSAPLPTHNRDVLHLLEALQILRVKVPGGGPAEARKLSFRALDIEQIGHVYEGLLDHTTVRATETILGLTGSKDKEPEVPLSTLEELREREEDDLLDFLKKATGRSVPALKKAISTPPADEGRWLAAFGNDEALAERARSFAGLLRDDMSGYPVVVLTGGVYVTKGSDRRESGTHYTPRSLTEPIVQHTLDPLVYKGPAEGWTKEDWKRRSANEILALTVCDMAMGSGAFLVQACRYLSERLVEAWEEARENRAPDRSPLPFDADERLALARRLVADRCLYGVDKNPLAVEMGKLSLWLITLQKDRPFTFLDHALCSGDSLLGVISPDQLTHWSLDPKGTRNIPWFTLATERALHTALDLRRQLHSFPVLSVRDAEAKARLLREAEEAMEMVRLGADLLVAAALRPAMRREAMSDLLLSEFHVQALAYEELREGTLTEESEAKVREGFAELREKADQLLGGRRPFHWPLEFPEVFVETEEPAIIDGRLPLDAGDLLAELSKPQEAFISGFAAIVGNPPFQGGQKITGSLGTDYRSFLVEHVASGKKGSADLCAYFFLQGRNVIREGGGMGLVATNTIAQGDTREVGLGQLTSDSCVITRAAPSRKWPGEANLEVANLWIQRGHWAGSYLLDERRVDGITSYLAALGATQGDPNRLAANAGKSFQGSIVLGMGFVLEPEQAMKIIDQDPRNRKVLMPYLNGEDLNSRPDQSPRRWVINFRDWPLEEAEFYSEPMRRVREMVKPERDRNKMKSRRELWWQFGSLAASLYTAVSKNDRVLVVGQTSKHHSFVFVSSGLVYDQKLVVFALESYRPLTLLQSTIHKEWVLKYGSTLETRPVYTPTDCFETFPFPIDLSSLEDIGERYYTHRRETMRTRQEGLTKTYNRFHNPAELSEDIGRLRELHVEMDRAVAGAYGWDDLDLGHGFHETKQGVRFTINEEARREVLDRLLLLNHERYAEEVEQGFHDKSTKKGKAKKRVKPKADGGTDSLLGSGGGA